jgi:hypothetical protein
MRKNHRAMQIAKSSDYVVVEAEEKIEGVWWCDPASGN